MRVLYPEIACNRQFMLSVSADHQIYVEESGQPDGIPVLFIHGGPGGGCLPWQRRFFNPEKYRIILFDQRGCGRSQPYASLENNTTPDLIEDMERIRNELAIERWVLFGGSWGSTLAVAYAEQFPQRVQALILRGVFLCRPKDIYWFYQDGASRVFPDAFAEFVKLVPPEERSNLLSAYYQRLTGTDELQRMAFAKAWSLWEGHCLTLHPSPSVVEQFADPHKALAMARIEAHYFMHDSFFRDNQLLADAEKMADIPGIIVHGRYDMVCPLDNALALHQAWPASRLQIIRDAGHAATEPGILDALVRATDELAQDVEPT